MQELAKYLKKRDMTQEAFGMLAGIGNSMVNQMLSGKKKPGLKLALKIEALTKGAVSVAAWR